MRFFTTALCVFLQPLYAAFILEIFMSKKIKFFNGNEIPKKGTYFSYPSFVQKNYHFCEKWYATREDIFLLLNRTVFLKCKYAIRAAKFCIEFIKQNRQKFNALTEISDKNNKVYIPDFTYSGMYTELDASSPIIADNQLVEKGLVYATAEEARNASKKLLQALKREMRRQKFNFLTEKPETGTTVFVTTLKRNLIEEIHFDQNNLDHVFYFEQGLLYLYSSDALQAAEQMLNDYS